MIIDSHQHFWRLGTGLYGWIKPDDTALRRDFTGAELAPQLREAGVESTILVQADNSEAELAELLAYAEAAGFVRGIVAPLEIGRPGAAGRIAEMARHRVVVGFRPVLAELANAPQAAAEALSSIEHSGLALDCLAVGPALDSIGGLAERHPGINFVLDHGGNPDPAPAGVDPAWRRRIERIAKHPNTCCKVSGLLTRMPALEVATHVAVLREVFGVDRLLWGSDWPVLTRAGDYAGWMALSRQFFTPEEAPGVFGDNAARIYKLGKRN